LWNAWPAQDGQDRAAAASALCFSTSLEYLAFPACFPSFSPFPGEPTLPGIRNHGLVSTVGPGRHSFFFLFVLVAGGWAGFATG
jgi:hypothetical protein